MIIAWDKDAWDSYLWWQAQDKSKVKRINALIEDIIRNGNEGIGKPEPLRYELSGYWSRRINDEHRLVYRLDTDRVTIVTCRYHYR
ncbi:Txe/YoeB family addiction module toxin [Nocardia cyriacigeorgica]|uniref:Endoribonuclease YoeB n=1 Tax=Nocardia cyriacigeorgica TaxID=135487 RepID=A0A5R8P9T5_9NOCA|nr:Txe/YoeB family addiction module toxin [Nocardia cyriacigeorgica]TLG03255.1 Txe/YoeB family addiction module toxin [Nocardia cyriacigeorgica]